MAYRPLEVARIAAPHERRQWPRVHFAEPVAVYLADNPAPLPGRVADLSVGGMQLRCSREQMADWFNRTGDLASAEPIWARWIINVADGRLVLEAECRRCYAVKTRNDELALGFEFVHLKPDSQSRLADWLLQQLEPAPLAPEAINPPPSPH